MNVASLSARLAGAFIAFPRLEGSLVVNGGGSRRAITPGVLDLAEAERAVVLQSFRARNRANGPRSARKRMLAARLIGARVRGSSCGLGELRAGKVASARACS